MTKRKSRKKKGRGKSLGQRKKTRSTKKIKKPKFFRPITQNKNPEKEEKYAPVVAAAAAPVSPVFGHESAGFGDEHKMYDDDYDERADEIGGRRKSRRKKRRRKSRKKRKTKRRRKRKTRKRR